MSIRSSCLLPFLIVWAVLSFSSAEVWAGDNLSKVRSALHRSDYAKAARELESADQTSPAALLLRARLGLLTGRYAEAARLARRAMRRGRNVEVGASPWLAEALFRQGQLSEAIDVLQKVVSNSNAHRAQLMLGQYLILDGKRRQAREPLMMVIRAYNDDRIKDDDPIGLSLVGRAAYLLRAHRDANDAFNMAERAGANQRVETLLWRAEQYLDKYDPGHAAQVVGEALKLSPNNPRVRVAAAHVKLEQAMDFGAAEAEIDRALKVDANLAEAYFVRAGLALRTMDLKAAEEAVQTGLRVNPNDLPLLSIQAATRFLAEDQAGVQELKKRVLSRNPEYAKFFRVVGKYAEWEHRYDDIVTMMREAVRIDAQDAKSYASLGLNLIRAGKEKQGLEELRKAWRRDKYNVRVYNTLQLYENTIAKDYVTVDGSKFRIRYHKKERAILERYVPGMLEAAWASMTKRYQFTPSTPVGIELYADSEHFSVRTSGLPNIGIQGVCFGKTLAALSPGAGNFNWGMILWHELAHVFHIQQSRSRVPRWFTEGMAEYETIIARPEWRREEDRALYLGLRAGKLPKLASFNRAFTHADDPRDVTMAYYAASQVAVFLAETYGFERVPAMLGQWGRGVRTDELIPAVFGVDAVTLDQRFHAWLKPRLQRYEKQFVPKLRAPKTLAAARKAVSEHPKDADKYVALALAQLREGKRQEAAATLQLARNMDPKHGEALYLALRLAMGLKDLDGAEKLITRLLSAGHDGYAVRMKAADLAEQKGDQAALGKHLLEAHRQDPSQAEPLQALYDLARKKDDEMGQLTALRQLAKLDQHDRRVYGRLLELLVKRGLWEEARVLGQSAIYVDVANPKVHYLYARALARTGYQVSAIFELNSAIIAGAAPDLAARVYKSLAAGYRKLNKDEYAKRAERLGREVQRPAGPAFP